VSSRDPEAGEQDEVTVAEARRPGAVAPVDDRAVGPEARAVEPVAVVVATAAVGVDPEAATTLAAATAEAVAVPDPDAGPTATSGRSTRRSTTVRPSRTTSRRRTSTGTPETSCRAFRRSSPTAWPGTW
jgi:hypothetical protein